MARWLARFSLTGGDTSLTALDRANIRILTIDTALFGIVEAGIGSFLAVYLVRSGAPALLVGLVSALPSLGAVLISVPVSRWVTRQPNPVRVVVVYRFWMRLTYLLIALVPFLNLGGFAPYVIIAWWGVSSLPAAVVNLAWTAVIADVIPAQRRPLVNGIRWALFSVITAIAGTAFGLLLEWVAFPLNFQLVFFISFIAGLITCYTFSLIRLPHAAGPVMAAGPRLGLLDLVDTVRSEPIFARYLLSTFIYRLGLNLPLPVFSIYWVTVMQATDALIGFRTTVAYAALIVSYLVWGYLATRRGLRLVLIASCGGLSLYPLLTAASTDIFWLLPVALLWGIFVSGLDIAFFETLLRTAPPDRRATYVAINSSLANAAIFVTPLVGAALADLIGLHASLVLAGVLSLLGTLLMGLLGVGRERPSSVATESGTATQ